MTGNDKGPRSQGVVPLRTILRNFLNLVESCESRIDTGNSTYDQEFQELKQFSESLKTDQAYACKEGEKTVNRKKNRYKDILPFDYTRVILGDYGDVPGSDYINANFIKGASGSSAYIACQGPLPHTVNDFWRMVVECEVQVIVMACNEQESGKHKCENYWVEEEGVEREFGQVKVWLKKCRQVCPDFLVRTMRISYVTTKGDREERNVCQFHYSAWPDHGVPTKVRPLLDMVRLIRDCQTSETLPVLVHCSAGCGRTGTICAIDYVWGLLRLGKLSEDFSLFKLVREMRRQRIAMVQTKDQYIMVHRAVKELFEEQLKIIDSHPYANVDFNGLPLDIKKDLEEPMYETVEYRPDPVVDKCHNARLPPKPGTKKSEENHRAQSAASQQQQQQMDDITVLSSEEDEVDSRHKEKKSIRSGLLRKPSIVKIKAFFEKSKEGKKSGGTSLSRAKSDVSSRFYNLASSFQSKSSPQKSPTPSVDVNAPPPKPKPPLLAKPLLPIKRSKSLKVGKEEESPRFFGQKKKEESVTRLPIEAVPSTPSGMILESQPPTVTELSNISHSSSSKSDGKPAVPPKSHLLKHPNKIKMGMAKEMDDSLLGRSEKPKYEKLKKFDTVVIKSPSNKQRTSLIRSQSHIWQPPKVQTAPCRIFSDENITHSTEHRSTNDILHSEVDKPRFTSSSESVHSKKLSSSGISITIDTGLKNTDYPDGKPAARRRVPKTIPYSNCTIIGNSTPPNDYSPTSEKGVDSSSAKGVNKEVRILRDLPQLKPASSRSRENSSESSSNNATPRSSLPSTPTQTIDSTYAQIMRTNIQGIGGGSKNFGRIHHGNGSVGSVQGKSILKGSLSSTPSESEEKLDSLRPQNSYNNPVNNVISAPQKIKSMRMPLGIRERRNSFRQAVCKDADSPPNNGDATGINHSQSFTNINNQAESNTNVPIRSHKDYEPIWPESGGGNGTTTNGYFHIGGYPRVSEDSYIHRAPLKPVAPADTKKGNSQIHQTHNNAQHNSTNSKKNHEDVKPQSSSGKQQPPFQSRLNDIQLMLEELKAPNTVRQQLIATGNSTHLGKSAEAPERDMLSSRNGLRPIARPPPPGTTQQQGQGMSCFTFAKKPTSLESITSAFHYEPKKDTEPLIHQNGKSSNDYVFIGKMGTGTKPFVEPSSKDNPQPRMDIHDAPHLIKSNGIPVAPPRTKKLQKSHTISIPNGANKMTELRLQKDSPWTSSSRIAPGGSNNLPEIVRCTSQQSHTSSGSSFSQNHSHNTNTTSGTTPTSPNHIIKALGIFQAKAANMRSKLSTWGEHREQRKVTDKVNGVARDSDEVDGGFRSTTTTNSSGGNSYLQQAQSSSARSASSSRQQYL